MKEKIRQQKRKSAGTNNTANKHQQTNRKKLVLEGRLDKVLKSNALPNQTGLLGYIVKPRDCFKLFEYDFTLRLKTTQKHLSIFFLLKETESFQ